MKIVFMGTPEYAAEALEALVAVGHDVVAAVTQPDKPRGRSGELVAPPVKLCAVRHAIPVLQPRRVKAAEAVEELRRYPADVYVVAAFGQILSQEILDIPPLGCLNIHASLLPKYRGASPIQHVLLEGEERTGITVMQMDAGIDTGDMLYKKEISVAPKDTYETLHDKLAKLGGVAITEALVLLEQGRLTPERQQEAASSYAPLIRKGMGRLDFSEDAQVLERKIRALTPWPGAFTSYHGRTLKIWRAEVAAQADSAGRAPGEILEAGRDSILAAAGGGALLIRELQLEGKKRMTARDFLLGVRMQPGEVLGG